MLPEFIHIQKTVVGVEGYIEWSKAHGYGVNDKALGCISLTYIVGNGERRVYCQGSAALLRGAVEGSGEGTRCLWSP